MVLSIALALLLAQAPPPGAAAPAARCVDIASFTDVHGHIEMLADMGGYLAVLRKRGPVVLIDGGDSFQGTIESNFSKGRAIVDAYGALGVDMAVVGNHEFDFGLDELKHRINEAKYPFITANIYEKASGKRAEWPNLAPRRIVRLQNGLAVGLFGLATEDTPNVTLPTNVVTLDFRDSVAAAKTEAAALRKEGAQLVVGVGHIGGRCRNVSNPDDLSSCESDSDMFKLLRALPKGTLDAYVGGHTHQFVAHHVNGIPAIQGGANGEALARVTICEGGTHQIYQPQKIESGGMYLDEKTVPSAAVAAAIAPYMSAAKAERERLLGVTLPATLARRRDGQSAFGTAITASLRQSAKTDFALYNAGGLRVDLPAGALTYGQLFEALPFENRLAVITLTGDTLEELVLALLNSGHGFPQVSGLSISHAGVSKCGGGRLNPKKTYTLATNDFLAAGGDGLRQIIAKIPKRQVVIKDDVSVRDAFAAWLKKPASERTSTPCP